MNTSRATFLAALAATPTAQPPATELTADDAQLLDTTDLSDNSTATRTAHTETTQNIRRLVCTALTAHEVAEKLGITTAQVQQARVARRLWGITDGQSWIFPSSQFETSDDSQQLRVIRGMEQVFKALPQDLHPLAIEGFLGTPQPDLLADQPVTPRQWLLRGGDITTLIAVASDAYS